MHDRFLLVELCSGSGIVSAVARANGWNAITVDNEEACKPDICADVRAIEPIWDRPVLIWCSPPCTEYSRESMPWSKTGKEPDMSIWNGCQRLIDASNPLWWVVENVRGAQKYHGRAVVNYGPFYLWGNFPLFPYHCRTLKGAISGRDPRRRAVIDPGLVQELLASCI